MLCLTCPSTADLTHSQGVSLFSEANSTFRNANLAAGDPEKAEQLYNTAILNYEKIINDGQVKNAKLYYNLGNAYFLNRDLGKAIVNYRRAETLDSSNSDIQKNLTFARSRRIDQVILKSEQRVLQTLFFWHYDFSTKTKFVIGLVCFAVFCLSLTTLVWFTRNAAGRVVAVISCVLIVCFLISVVIDSQNLANRICGVIISSEVIARQGDGHNYSSSFKEPLHSGTEFDLLELRPGWFHIRLGDNSDGWVPQSSAELI